MKKEIKKIYQYYKVKEERGETENLWKNCYDYTFPEQNPFYQSSISLYDSTSSSCIDQLSSHLLSELTPPYSAWFSLNCNNDNLNKKQENGAEEKLSKTEEKIYDHLSKSNFYSSIHQCFTELCVLGTSCLLFEESALGSPSAFSFKSVPMKDIYISGSEGKELETVYKKSTLNYEELKNKFSTFQLSKDELKELKDDKELKINIIECVYKEGQKYNYFAFTENENVILSKGEFSNNPFIIFRFAKSATSVYGKSPTSKALPDIKTANKIVELVLKNASLAVSGVWLADDDGVLNPSNIEITPGAIIPKAMGSSGLTPLKIGSDFNVSDLILTDIRNNIKSSFLSDQLQPFNQNFNMSATEVLQRSALSLKVLGSTYGRLQSELLTPLIMRCYSILQRRGEIKTKQLNKEIKVNYTSKMSSLKGYEDVLNIMEWVKTVSSLGSFYSEQIDKQEVLEYITKKLNVSPEFLLKKEKELENKLLEFACKLPKDFLINLLSLNEEELSNNFENYSTWIQERNNQIT